MKSQTLISVSYLSLLLGCAHQGRPEHQTEKGARDRPARTSEASADQEERTLVRASPESGSTEHPGRLIEVMDAERRRGEPVRLRYPRGSRSWLGVEMQATPPAAAGIEVVRVFRGSPAREAGLRPGDTVLRFGETPVDSPSQLAGLVLGMEPGSDVPVALLRGGKPLLLRVSLEGQPEFEDRLRLAFVGRPAPSIDGVIAFQGEAATLRELRGRVVLLEFWATWCGVCRYLAPVLDRLEKQHRAAGLSVLGITVDPPERARSAAIRAGHMDYALASDADGHVTRDYLASQVPTVFVLDRAGFVVDVMVGVSDERVKELVAQVEALLDAPR